MTPDAEAKARSLAEAALKYYADLGPLCSDAEGCGCVESRARALLAALDARVSGDGVRGIPRAGTPATGPEEAEITAPPTLSTPAPAHALADFSTLVTASLAKARDKHRPQTSRHGAYAVILEELDEVRETVWHDAPDADYLKELVHTAAMCQRAAEDANLTPAALDAEPLRLDRVAVGRFIAGWFITSNLVKTTQGEPQALADALIDHFALATPLRLDRERLARLLVAVREWADENLSTGDELALREFLARLEADRGK